MAGEGVQEIFESLGYDIKILDDSRIYCFAQKLAAKAEAGEVLTDTPMPSEQKRPVVDYNTLPAQQSVAAMQREIAYLSQQVEFPKNYRAGQRQKVELMLMENPSAKFEITHEIVSQEGNLQNVRELCQIAGVSRSGYNWLASANTRLAREQADRQNFERILRAYNYRGYNKGIRGVHMRLLHMNPPVLMNVKKIQRLMCKYGLRCPIRKANPYRRMAKALKTNTP